MGTIRNVIVGAAGLVVTGIGTWNTLDVVIQPGTPSKAPRPADPQPEPKNTQPRPSNPTPDPKDPGEKIDPADRKNDSDGVRDGVDGVRDGTSGRRTNANRYVRPFAFDNPSNEGRFNLATRRLLAMEARMQRSHENLLKRLGEARQLSGERQTAALFDVLQQMLKDQADLQRYLAQARGAWSGDLDPLNEDELKQQDESPREPDGNADR